MKKLSKLKLTSLSEANLSEREMNMFLGGTRLCSCSCAGPSSTSDNKSANYGLGSSGGSSTSGCNEYIQAEGSLDGYCSSCDSAIAP